MESNNNTDAVTPVSHVSALNISVRAKKACAALNINTVSELTNRSAADLMECKNFGATSLKGIREALAAIGLSLAGEGTNADA